MQKNVGTIDSIIRITLGLFGLAWSISQAVKHPRRKMPMFIAFQSALKVAEGITRFCPGLALLGINTLNEGDKERKAPFSTISYARRKVEKPPHPSLQEQEERGAIYE